MLVPDGLFLLPGDGAESCQFHALLPYTDDDVLMLTVRLAERLQTVAQRQLEPSGGHSDGEDAHAEDALVRQCASAPESTKSEPSHRRAAPKPLCANVEGFSLHAARSVAAQDPTGLGRLCSYGLRAPFYVGECG
ncbi:MAG: hypothetical protein AMXMBFR64_53360 [Myxococcales bacterium]